MKLRQWILLLRHRNFESQPSTKLACYTKLTACGTFFLLCAGALVTSTGSGLAVPDWPLSYGQFFPPLIGGILYEHGHRMIAGAVGILMLIQAVWIGLTDKRRWMKGLVAGAFMVIFLQAVLGGLTVLFLLPDAVSIGHAALAEIFFGLAVVMALLTSRAWCEGKISGDSHGEPTVAVGSHFRSFRILGVITTVAIYIQILLGAYYRHTESGLTSHIIGACVVSGLIGRYAFGVMRSFPHGARLVRWSSGCFVLLIVQLVVGPAALLAKLLTQELIQPHILKVIFTAAHLALGALLLATSLVLTLWIYRYSWSGEARTPERTEEAASC